MPEYFLIWDYTHDPRARHLVSSTHCGKAAFMSESVGEKLRNNARSGIVTWAWAQVVMMARLMVYYHFLDAAGYGLWTLAFSVLNFFFFYSFGINNAFIKYTAECTAKEDYPRLSILLSTGMAASLAMGAAILAVLFIFTDATLAWFNFDAQHNADAHFVLQGIGIVSACSIAFGVYKAVLTGVQRLQLINGSAIVFLNCEVALSFFLLYQGYGIRALVFVYAVSGIGNLLVLGYFVHRHVPQLHINPFRAKRSALPDVFGLGAKMQVLGGISLVSASIDKVVFAGYNGLAFAGIYAIARTVAERAQGGAHQAFGALAPASADLFARGDFARLSKVYALTLRMCFLGCLYLFSFMGVVSDYTMLFFQGSKYDTASASALSVLCIALTFHTLTGPGSSMQRGAGMVLREMSYHLLTIVSFVGLFAITRQLGLSEAWQVQAYSAALSLGSVTFVIISNRFFHAPWHTPFLSMAPLAIAAPLCAWLVVFLFDTVGLREVLPMTRLGSVAALGVLGSSYTVLFGLCTWLLPGLPQEDKMQFVKLVPGATKLLARLRPGG